MNYFTSLIIFLVTLPGCMSAGGIYMTEYASPSLGTAGVGSAAVAIDAATAFENPAGMTRIQGNEFMQGLGLLGVDLCFDANDSTPIIGNSGGSPGGAVPLAGSFLVYSLNDCLKFGLGVTSRSGAMLDYNDEWVGRYFVQDITAITLIANPSVAYRITPQLSIGAGFDVQWMYFVQTIAGPPPNGTGQIRLRADDFAYGYNIGLLYEFNSCTRLGLHYRSKIKHDLDGDLSVKPANFSFGFQTEFIYPQSVLLSLYHQFSPLCAVLVDVGWDEWSVLDKQILSVEQGSKVLNRNWNDTFHGGIGFHYYPNECWILQSGIAYDSSPVNAKNRTPDLPIDRVIRFGLGAQRFICKSLKIGASYEFSNWQDARINRTILKGSYDRYNGHIVGLFSNWCF